MRRDRLGLVVEAVIRDPASLFMGTYAHRNDCGTTMCLAGHAAVLAGWQIEFKPIQGDGRYEEYATTCFRVERGSRLTRGIESIAREWLELDYNDAFALFHCTHFGNDLQRVIERINLIAGTNFSVEVTP